MKPEMNTSQAEINSNNNNNNHQWAINDGECTVREQDRFMPIANVIRIMRKILPPHAKISDEAKETIQECVSEFISFITGEANERCQREQRKTITAEDVLWAMSKLGFDDYIEPLTVYLNRYREFEGDRGGSSIRVDPAGLVMKRTASDLSAAGSLTMPAFVPVFHLGNHHGFFGAAGMGGFHKDDASSDADAGSSHAAMASLDPYAHSNK
ncbi:Nuclear transcription factor Y subunit B-6 [Sarracenia purpurea var. burkii]